MRRDHAVQAEDQHDREGDGDDGEPGAQLAAPQVAGRESDPESQVGEHDVTSAVGLGGGR